MSNVTFDFKNALSHGIYFDHCIDLYFFKEDMELMYILKTPEKGYKPDITVKGTLIEGSSAISSFISITNMHYDIDINAVRFIKCRMYYKGLKSKNVGTINNYKGHDILFSVLYADQDKEPPNRAIRFQCTIAASDYTRLNAEVFIDSYGNFSHTQSDSDDGNGTIKLISFKQYLKNICDIYNESLPNYLKKEGNNTSNLLIDTIVIQNEAFEEEEVTVEVKQEKLSDLLNKLNSTAKLIDGKFYNVWKVYIENNQLVASVLPAPNDKLEDNKYFQVRQSGGIYSTDLSPKIDKNNEKSVILYYTKSAYRNETIINVTTTFDDRIYPGCLCSIMANTIMGKAKSRSSKITHFTNEVVTFRITGKIDYEFSTTQGGYMTMQGPVVRDEDMNSFSSWRGVSLNGK